MLAVLMLNRMQNKRRNLRKQKLRTTKITNAEVIPEYCRTCLGADDLVSIFYTRETSKKRTEDLKLVTGVEIKMNDGLSQKICTNCIETMNTALQFRIQTDKNDKKLRNLLHIENNGVLNNQNEYDTVNDMDNDDNNDMGIDNAEFDEDCYLSLDEDIQTDHDYLELDDVPKKPAKRRSSPDRPGKVYKCEECCKEYNRKTAYRSHMNKHNNYRICEECGKQCLNNTMLLQHKRALHGMPRIHVCEHCDYTSATKAGLVTHSRRHTGERPYVCEQCGAAFSSRGSLVQHLPIHLTESNFECSICNKREKSKKLLQHHIHKVHRPKPYRYACPLCGDLFKRPSSARVHLAASHTVPRCDQPPLTRQEIQVREPEETTVVEDFQIDNYS